MLKLAVPLAAAAFCAGVSGVAQAVDLTPHRALYKMKLVSATRGSGVAQASGSMVYSFNENCDAWSSETTVKLKLVYSKSGQVETNWAFASWEAKDGKSYRFRVRHLRDGSTVEDLKGVVRRDAPDDAAEAVFTAPKDRKIKLPAGTLFPTRHLIDLISAGIAGKPVFSRTVFDGASMDNPYEVNAIIGKERSAQSKRAQEARTLFGTAGLKQQPIRHVRMAFFPAGSKQAEPEFELGVDYRKDGIARAIRQDFGDFVIDLMPDSIETLKRPAC